MPAPRYPWNLLPQLATAIETGQRNATRQHLDALLAVIAVSSGNDLTLRKLRCAQLVSGCLRGAHHGGVASDLLLREHMRLLKTLAELRTWSAVCRRLHRYVDRLRQQIAPPHRSRMERIVAQVRADLLARSLAEHAQAHGVSVGHLSRLFTALTGHTFREELRRARMAKACRLLQETDLKISAIAARLGVCDPSQFSSDFRRATGLTPSQYRVRHSR